MIHGVFSAFLVLAVMGAATTQDVAKENILFHRTLQNGVEFVVTTGEPLDLSALRELWVDPQIAKVTKAYAIRVELRQTGRTPLELATRLRVETESPNLGCAILDVRIESRCVLIAMTEGDDVVVWRVQAPAVEVSQAVVLSRRMWAGAALAEPLRPGSVRAAWRRASDGRLLLETVDLRGIPNQVSLLQQVDDKWEFIRILKQGGPPDD